MRQERAFKSLRTYLLSLLFVFYYGGIALICWALWCASNGVDVTSFFENRVRLYFTLGGLASGVILFLTAIQQVQLALRGYWNQRSVRGVSKALLYLSSQLLLFCLPFELSRHGSWLIQQLTPSFFILALSVALTGITYSRYKGITNTGLFVCAP